MKSLDCSLFLVALLKLEIAAGVCATRLALPLLWLVFDLALCNVAFTAYTLEMQVLSMLLQDGCFFDSFVLIVDALRVSSCPGTKQLGLPHAILCRC